MWDITHPNYYNREARRGKWGEIAIRCGMTDQKARKRFKWIRDEYRNQTKKLEMGLQLSDKRLRWMESLSFLRNLKSRYRRPPNHNIYGGLAHYQNDSNDYDEGSENNELLSYNDSTLYDSPYPPVPIVSMDESDTALPGFIANHNSIQRDEVHVDGENEHSMYSTQQKKHNDELTIQQQHQQQNHDEYNNQHCQQQQQQQPKNHVTINLTANPEKNVTLGDFIDELIQQEPVDLRERFMVEVMESFVKIKRQFLYERINHTL